MWHNHESIPISSLSVSFASSESSLLAASRLLNRSYLISFFEAWRSLIISDMYCCVPLLFLTQKKNIQRRTWSSSNASLTFRVRFVRPRALSGTMSFKNTSVVTMWRASLKVIWCPMGKIASSCHEILRPNPKYHKWMDRIRAGMEEKNEPAAPITKSAIWY